MSFRRALLFLLGPFSLTVLSAPAFAESGDGHTRLHVCNKGELPVAVAVARSEGSLFQGPYWVISGVTVAPQNCAVVYDQIGQGAYSEDPSTGKRYSVVESPGEALLGFGLKETAGRFVSLRATSVPDLGKIVTRASRTLCVDPLTTPVFHTTDSKLFETARCAELELPGVSRAVPLTTAYHFSWPGGLPGTAGGDYYLNITPKPATGEIDVTGGYGVDEDHAAPGLTPEEKAMDKAQKALQDAFIKGVRDSVRQAAEEEAKRREAADPINQAAANRKIFEARRDSIDYAAEHTRNIGRIRELSQFSPDWLLTTEPLLYVRGTVARVEMPSGPRQPARLYFKESPDSAFIACIPAPQIFNLQQYVGKHLEVRGRVSQSNCGGKVGDVQVVNPAMILDLAKGTPSDEAVLPGMNAAPSSGNASRAMTAIPIATRIRVSLTNDIDLQHATNGATFQGQLAAPITLPDGLIPQGAAVVLIHDAYSPLGVSSVTAEGKVWRVASKLDPPASAVNANVLRAGTTLVFAVAGTDAPVVVGR